MLSVGLTLSFFQGQFLTRLSIEITARLKKDSCMSSHPVQKTDVKTNPRMLVVVSNDEGQKASNYLNVKENREDTPIGMENGANVVNSSHPAGYAFKNDNGSTDGSTSLTTHGPISDLTESQIRIQQSALANEYTHLARALSRSLEKRTDLILQKMEIMEKSNNSHFHVEDDRPHLQQMAKLLSYQINSIKQNTQHEAVNIWRDFYRQKMDLRYNMGIQRMNKISKIRNEFKASDLTEKTNLNIKDWISFNLDTVRNVSEYGHLSSLDPDDIKGDILLINSLREGKRTFDDESSSLDNGDEQDDDIDEEYADAVVESHTESGVEESDAYKDNTLDHYSDTNSKRSNSNEFDLESRYRLEEAKRRKLASQRESRKTIRFVDPVQSAPQKRLRISTTQISLNDKPSEETQPVQPSQQSYNQTPKQANKQPFAQPNSPVEAEATQSNTHPQQNFVQLKEEEPAPTVSTNTYVPQQPSRQPIPVVQTDTYGAQSQTAPPVTQHTTAAPLVNNTVPATQTPQGNPVRLYQYQTSPVQQSQFPQILPQQQPSQYYSVASPLRQYQFGEPQQYQYYNSYPSVMPTYPQYQYPQPATQGAYAPAQIAQPGTGGYVYFTDQWNQGQYSAPTWTGQQYKMWPQQ